MYEQTNIIFNANGELIPLELFMRVQQYRQKYDYYYYSSMFPLRKIVVCSELFAIWPFRFFINNKTNLELHSS